jgi:hypothetical protein
LSGNGLVVVWPRPLSLTSRHHIKLALCGPSRRRVITTGQNLVAGMEMPTPSIRDGPRRTGPPPPTNPNFICSSGGQSRPLLTGCWYQAIRPATYLRLSPRDFLVMISLGGDQASIRKINRRAEIVPWRQSRSILWRSTLYIQLVVVHCACLMFSAAQIEASQAVMQGAKPVDILVG